MRTLDERIDLEMVLDRIHAAGRGSISVDGPGPATHASIDFWTLPSVLIDLAGDITGQAVAGLRERAAELNAVADRLEGRS